MLLEFLNFAISVETSSNLKNDAVKVEYFIPKGSKYKKFQFYTPVDYDSLTRQNFKKKKNIVLILFPLPIEYFKKQPPEMFCRKGVLRNLAKFTRKHLCQSIF